MLVIKGSIARSNSKAVREVSKIMLGGKLKAVDFHVFHSQGDKLAETHFVFTVDAKYFYVLHGTCMVKNGKKMSKEIMDMIDTFRLTKK